MNKKVSLIVLVPSLLMLFTEVAPIMAEPVTKVSASTTILSSIYYSPLQVQITPSGVAHIREINYINTRTLTIGDDDYDVYVVGSFDINRTQQLVPLSFTSSRFGMLEVSWNLHLMDSQLKQKLKSTTMIL